jgi:hypothetical protein
MGVMIPTRTTEARAETQDRTLRVLALIQLGLLIPSALGSALVPLSSPRMIQCLDYGDSCSSVGFWPVLAFAASGVLGILTLVCPRNALPRVTRGLVVCGQAAALVVMVALILNYY